jgi:HSP20 family protein
MLPNGRTAKKWGPFVYGYSIRMGPDGKPRVREFGNIQPGTRLGRPRINIKERREPLTDVITTDEKVEVVMELPGVEKKDIKLHGLEDSLMISVDTSQRKYHKKVALPVKVDPSRVKSSYKNGVLEVILPKKKEVEHKGNEQFKDRKE